MNAWKDQSLGGKLKLIAFILAPVLFLVVLAEGYTFMTRDRVVSDWKEPDTGLRYYSMKIGRWPWSPRSITPLN